MKKFSTLASIATASALLAGCIPAGTGLDGENSPPPSADACGAAGLAAYVGKADSPALQKQISAESKAKAIRMLTPGMAVTMDYRADRLNVNIDANGRYTSFACG